ncbi:hypothetical protein [Deminuibacter soli]|uniref:Uncharacterized protein n=1 Tax=Deminuibacter soli TaxID=2291815 RepID=A0A3E1NKW9_9BACT|nr:hypothetical protein [Deminuibacter soli]RFM28547.1 hypothetical protein DXN05_07015 [Deminuibacter soli]
MKYNQGLAFSQNINWYHGTDEYIGDSFRLDMNRMSHRVGWGAGANFTNDLGLALHYSRERCLFKRRSAFLNKHRDYAAGDTWGVDTERFDKLFAEEMKSVGYGKIYLAELTGARILDLTLAPFSNFMKAKNQGMFEDKKQAFIELIDTFNLEAGKHIKNPRKFESMISAKYISAELGFDAVYHMETTFSTGIDKSQVVIRKENPAITVFNTVAIQRMKEIPLLQALKDVISQANAFHIDCQTGGESKDLEMGI